MLRHSLFSGLCLTIALSAVSRLQDSAGKNDREDNRRAIRAHIESICQAFIDGDAETIHATHTEDWRGFLESSKKPIKGISEYMAANGIAWPRSAEIPQPSKAPVGREIGFRVSDFDVHFLGKETAVVCFLLDFGVDGEGGFTTLNRFRILDVYAMREGRWNQAASHTVMDPTWRSRAAASLGPVPQPIRDRVLGDREALWQAYSVNDQKALARLISADAIAFGETAGVWTTRDVVLADAARLSAGEERLIRREFPKTEMQMQGGLVILYSSFILEMESKAGRTTRTGSAVEVFARRGDGYVCVGRHIRTDA